MTGTLHEDQNTFFITFHLIFVRMKNVLDISVEKIKTHTECPKKIELFFYFFFLGAQCVESGVSCTD